MQAKSIFITTTAVNTLDRPWLTANYERMIRAARAYCGGDFRRVDAPENADFILFVDYSEPYLGDIFRSPVFQRYEDRSFVYSAHEAPLPRLPGMYPDVVGPVRLPELQLGAFYLRCFDNALLATAPERDRKPKWLFSFIGARKNAPAVRERVLALSHPNALLVNRSSGMRDDDFDYVDTLRDSQFILCPRGQGPTSWRFYEAMMAARVPVIISDEWVPARDIDWSSFSLRVPESDIKSIPSLCEAHRGRAQEMGLRARREWEKHCSLEQAFGWVGRRLRELREASAGRKARGVFDFTRDLVFRGHVLRYARWRAGETLRHFGVR